MTIYERIISLALLLLVAIPASSRATAVVVPLLREPVTISENPPVHVIAQGPLSISMYRVTLEVENTDTSDTLALAATRNALMTYVNESGRTVNNPRPSMEGNIWVTYDEDQRRYPLRRMKIAWTRGIDSSEVQRDVDAKFLEEIPFPGRSITAIDLDFELPPELPARISLYIADVNLGRGNPITIRVNKDLTQAERVFLNQSRRIASQRLEQLRKEREAKQAAPSEASDGDQQTQ